MLLTVLTVYVVGFVAALVVLGYLNATVALGSRASMSDGMALFSGEATGRNLTTALCWPMIMFYIISYKALLRYIIFLNNRQIKKNVVASEPTSVHIEVEPEINSTPFDPTMN